MPNLDQLIQRDGHAAVENNVPRSLYLDHLDKFEALITEVGTEQLESFTRCDATGRRGGKFGFKRRVDQGITGPESKDIFMFRSNCRQFIDRIAMPEVLIEFIESGLDLMTQTSTALRQAMFELNDQYPGIYDLHYGNLEIVDEGMRTLLYDEREKPNVFVSEPHLDVSSLTLHAYDSRPGTFFTVHGGKLRFPSEGGENQAIVFPGGWLGLPEICPEFTTKAVWHGAVAGSTTTDGRRRGVVVQQIQPRLDIESIPPSFEAVHAESSGMVAAIVDAGVQALL